jgi:nucleotidyltransferase/DNA polymerase involved in DNA repair
VTRSILHVDMDAFFASVEQRDNPELRGKPVIVGAGPHERGVVAAASYEARKFGVHSAMPSRTAYKLCPHGVFVHPHMEKYSEASRQIMTILETFTPLVQPVSVDEAFLDVTASIGMFGDALTIAKRIKVEIHTKTGLTASVGVAPNKFLAKLASDLKKPDGLAVITDTDKVQILEPLPVSKIWGVGKVTEKHLHEMGLQTIGDIQRMPLDELRQQFGNLADQLHSLALGEDDREVETDGESKSISSEHTFDVDTSDLDQIKKCLLEQCEEVGSRLRQEKVAARTVQLKLRYADFTTLTRQITVEEPLTEAGDIYRLGCFLLGREKLVSRPLRLLGLGVASLREPAAKQLVLL